jgi:glutamate-1-semialdehyde 2,1-aminomutase
MRPEGRETMKRDKSIRLYEEAVRLMPGGVNSPVRAFRSVNETPFFVERSKGAYLYDVDGNAYLDFVASWGAIILGHAHDGLVKEAQAAVADGTSYGACHPNEAKLARLLIEAFPSMEKVRLTSSGTEATMSAVRLARGATGKNGIIKFRGCYHGHVDSLLVKAGSGLATFGIPDSAGVPADLAKHTFVAEFNHLDSVRAIVNENEDIACVIIEPIMGNMGVILPEKGFLEGVQELCNKAGILLIFDEVITGFRVTYGGAQHLYNIDPDLTCLGKIIGGGFPIGAFGGKASIMDHIAPLGSVYQAGTLSGNPVAVRAGIYALNFLKTENPYDSLKVKVELLARNVLESAARFGIPYRINGVTGMFTGFFSSKDVTDYESAVQASRDVYARFFGMMLEEGIFFAPSPFEASFLTLAHSEVEIGKTIEAFDRTFKRLANAN